MKTGDYVRTKDGIIGKIESEDYTYSRRWIIDTLWYDYDKDDWSTTIMQWDIVKSSPNIIDLIEVGDYVNGSFVVNKKLDSIDIIQLILPFELKEKDIKSVVTKESMESVTYYVK